MTRRIEFKPGDKIRLTIAWPAPPYGAPGFAYHQVGEVIEGPDAKGLVRCVFYDTPSISGVGVYQGSHGRIYPIPDRYLEHIK